eukprot:9216028-Alexandrium_andersonii.AAC.1
MVQGPRRLLCCADEPSFLGRNRTSSRGTSTARAAPDCKQQTATTPGAPGGACLTACLLAFVPAHSPAYLPKPEHGI